MNKKTIRLTEGYLHKVINESIKKIINESNDFYSFIKGARNSPEYEKGFKEGISDARNVRDNNERNQLIDRKEYLLRRYKKAFDNGNTFILNHPNDRWTFGWVDGVTYEFKEADAYEELQNQDYGPGWQFE